MVVKQNSLGERRVGFIAIACGGVGLSAQLQLIERYQADGRPFPLVTVLVDTDPITSPLVDHTIHIGLKDTDVDALAADPDKFGRPVRTILDKMSAYLSPEDITNGSRTIRCLTQLALAKNETKLALGLRAAIHQLIESQGVTDIIPILFGSSGGGTGSALQILLPLKLREPAFQARALSGLPKHLLQTPIAFVSEPYALAQLHEPSHAAKILANAYAYRIESVALERIRAIKYVVHVGFANRHGVVLNSPDMIGRVLGTCLYEWQRSWTFLKNRFVDTVDSQTLSTKGYTGKDRPEDRLAKPSDSSSLNGKPTSNGGAL